MLVAIIFGGFENIPMWRRFNFLAILLKESEYRVYPNTRVPPNTHAPPFLEPRNNDCVRYFTYYRPRCEFYTFFTIYSRYIHDIFNVLTQIIDYWHQVSIGLSEYTDILFNDVRAIIRRFRHKSGRVRLCYFIFRLLPDHLV